MSSKREAEGHVTLGQKTWGDRQRMQPGSWESEVGSLSHETQVGWDGGNGKERASPLGPTEGTEPDPSPVKLVSHFRLLEL